MLEGRRGEDAISKVLFQVEKDLEEGVKGMRSFLWGSEKCFGFVQSIVLNTMFVRCCFFICFRC